jgi:hypothetical protein
MIQAACGVLHVCVGVGVGVCAEDEEVGGREIERERARERARAKGVPLDPGCLVGSRGRYCSSSPPQCARAGHRAH